MARLTARPRPDVPSDAPIQAQEAPGVLTARPRPAPIRVALVDDHHLVREGLRLVLSSDEDFDVVGEAATHEEAFNLVAAQRPDVVILDLNFPEGDGISLLRALRDRDPELRVIILTIDRAPETVRQALVEGASGYVVKGARSRDLFDAIHAVWRGERYLHSSIAGAIIDDSIRWMQAGRDVTVREREILSHLASGLSAAQIARILGISVHTVRRHVANISGKLGLQGRSALIEYAVKHGLVRGS